MTKQKTITVNGERIRIVAHERTYTGNKCGFNVRVNGTRHFVNCLSFDEAMDKALARYLGTERSTAMAKQKKATKATGRGKDARVAKTSAKAAKATTETPERDTAQQGAPEAKKKRTGLMDAAAKVVAEADQADLPMSTAKMVEVAMSKGYWSPAKGGKTPANTLYAMILRDMTKHGGDAKFRRAEDHFGRGRFFLNR